jgi:uncharacterized RDD family membrane protein YckC
VLNEDTGEFHPMSVAATVGGQQTLFPGHARSADGPNVIPFESLQRQTAGQGTGRPPALVPEMQPLSPQAVPAPRRAHAASRATPKAAVESAQGSLDFIPYSSLQGRRLKTNVEAQVFCDQPVATPAHRFAAAAVDGAMILIGFGLVVITFRGMGGSFGPGRVMWIGLAATLALVSLLYGLIWVVAGRETLGMTFADLQLITFDGFPLDPRSRMLRFASTWLSFCSGGVGLLWAMADEENLTWHDHISKTFPTVREVPGTFVRQRT